MISKPYAHAGLPAGEVQPGGLSDEKYDMSFVFETLRENVANTQKPLRV